MAEAKDALDAYFEYYNCERRHQSLDRRTPYEVYIWGPLPKAEGSSMNKQLALKSHAQLYQTIRPFLLACFPS